ncbi:MAG: adenosine deaminase [Chloroflexota bacterium]
MSYQRTKRPHEFYQALPKVELHRHLEGSMRLNTLIEIGRSHGIEIMGTGYLRSLVQIGEDEPYTCDNFLSKFAALRVFYRSPEVIGRVTREAIEDAAIDNVRYLELRFTPVALSRAEDFPLDEVMDWVIESAQAGEKEYGVITRLIASVNRHESVELAEQVTSLAIERKDAGIVGLDLAGGEANSPATPFIGLFREAQQDGLQITIHAGEWGGAPNVFEAIKEFGVKRIGHGVRIMEDASTVAIARERETVFEVCITSNYQSGVVPVLKKHPFPQMLSAGLNATLNTDDPSVSQITLSDEYRLACEELGVPVSVLAGRILAAAQAAFLPEEERYQLGQSLEKELSKFKTRG